MWSPSQVVAPGKRAFGPLDRVSRPTADWHLSRAAQLSRLLMETPRVNLLLVGVDRELWHLLDTQEFDLREPIATWFPGERLALPVPTQVGTLILHDVAALSHDDQRHLLEWLEPAARFVQVISTYLHCALSSRGRRCFQRYAVLPPEHDVPGHEQQRRDVVTRFAPAPTGYLHLGHVVNAIYVWGMARACGQDGSVLLRIEDHDRSRSRLDFEVALMEDLDWLGFTADGRPSRQSERGVHYERVLQDLRERGLVYACACSRTDIGFSRYPGTCAAKRIPEAPGLGLRVRLDRTIECFNDLRLGPQEQQPSEQCGDVLVRDRSGNWTYHFAAVVDDWLQGVTLVVRGEDLARFDGTPDPAGACDRPPGTARVSSPRARDEDANAEAQ